MSNRTGVESVVVADHEAEIEEIVKAAMTAARNKPNTPPDGGWGYEEPAKESMSGSVPVAIEETARRLVGQGVSYAGEVPVIPDRPRPGFEPFPTLP